MNPPPDSDEALMLAYAGGDPRAFERLYQRHRGWLYRVLLRQTRDEGQAQDLFQETWHALIRSAPGYRPTARFSTWLYRLARHRLIDASRSVAAANPTVSFDDDGDGHLAAELAQRVDDRANPQAMAERRQLAQRLLAALGALPAEQREAFLLFQEGGMSLEEIAQATGVPRETVKSRLRYARSRLAHSLAGEHR